MRPDRRSHISGIIRPFLCLSVCVLLVVSCSRQSADSRFASSLARIDSRIASGDAKQALKQLVSLRSKASSASQWLSLVKRERVLNAYGQSLATLKKALIQIPASTELAAVMVDTLTRLDRFEDACAYTDSILTSSYSAVSALPEIKRELKNNALTMNPQYWEAAFRATGDPGFHRNSAVFYAAAGNYAAACAQTVPRTDEMETSETESVGVDTNLNDVPNTKVEAWIMPDEEYFRALLCYDAGFTDQVFRYLDRNSLSKRNFAELALMADAAVKQKDNASARLFWREYANRSRASQAAVRSPLPLYDLAVTDDDPLEARNDLETCLGYFPAYYPAVCKYVRSVPLTPPPEETNPVARELLEAGFFSLKMEEQARRAPVAAEMAEKVLSTAMKDRTGAVDTRIFLEDFRFNQLQNPDRVRSASQMWKLLERYSDDTAVKDYALWYFASIGDFDAAFGLNRASADTASPFYTALEQARDGDLKKAEENFALVAGSNPDAWCALANIARIREKQEDFTGAVEDLSTASSLAPDDGIRSVLHYHAARILVNMHSNERAISVLGYALQLNPSNYRAATLLRELDAVK